MTITPILTSSLIHFSSGRLGEYTFRTWNYSWTWKHRFNIVGDRRKDCEFYWQRVSQPLTKTFTLPEGLDNLLDSTFSCTQVTSGFPGHSMKRCDKQGTKTRKKNHWITSENGAPNYFLLFQSSHSPPASLNHTTVSFRSQYVGTVKLTSLDCLRSCSSRIILIEVVSSLLCTSYFVWALRCSPSCWPRRICNCSSWVLQK